MRPSLVFVAVFIVASALTFRVIYGWKRSYEANRDTITQEAAQSVARFSEASRAPASADKAPRPVESGRPQPKVAGHDSHPAVSDQDGQDGTFTDFGTDGVEYWCRPSPVEIDGASGSCWYRSACYRCARGGITSPEDPASASPRCADESAPLSVTIQCCASEDGYPFRSCPALRDCLHAESIGCKTNP